MRAIPAVVLLALASACVTPSRSSRLEPAGSGPPEPRSASRPGTEAAPAESRRGDEIVIAGRRFHTGTDVVLWTDPGGYDAYRLAPRFSAEGPRGPRHHAGRPVGDPPVRRGDDLADLRTIVHQLVLHYDACGTSRECFRVLHDVRKLSVHFLLDVDGTLYQTLDLKERAWHAGAANTASIGVEIANIGAYPPGAAEPLDAWYRTDAGGTRLAIPARLEGGGVRLPGVRRPARDGRVRGRVQGQELVQVDFTREQYEALVRLAATLVEVFPRIEARVPRDARGEVRTTALDADALAAFEGILGHCHVAPGKLDPGPAFAWERFLADVERELGARRADVAP